MGFYRAVAEKRRNLGGVTTTPHIFVELHPRRRCQPEPSGGASTNVSVDCSVPQYRTYAGTVRNNLKVSIMIKKLTWTWDETIIVLNKLGYFQSPAGQLPDQWRLQKSSPSFLGAADGFSCSSSSIGGRLYGLITKPLDALMLKDRFSRKWPESAPPPPFS